MKKATQCGWRRVAFGLSFGSHSLRRYDPDQVEGRRGITRPLSPLARTPLVCKLGAV
jgi:hypothetical protein